jgi:hypothetical protein
LEDVIVVTSSLEDLARDPAYYGHFSYAVTRALSITPSFSCIQRVLSEQGRLVLWRSKPLGSTFGAEGFTVEQEYPYELPFGYGTRRLSVLRPVPSANVPRGTSPVHWLGLLE